MSTVRKQTKARYERLRQVVAGKTAMLIVLQDNPDPDAVAAAVALRRLAHEVAQVPCTFFCGGTVGRAENRALVRYLDLKLHGVGEVDFGRFDLIALVDTQPGTGNNSLPPDVTPHIVIDHHPLRKATRSVQFTDVRRRCGATATILHQYLVAAGIEPDMPLATALLYGIRSDTQDLGREATKADLQAGIALFPLANLRMLSYIQRGEVPRQWFQMLAGAIENARVYGRAIVTHLGTVENPDMIGEVADLLLREEQTLWTMATGVFNEKLLLSLRTCQYETSAGELARRLVARRGTGGGHDTYAGGQVAVAGRSEHQVASLVSMLTRRFLQSIHMADSPEERLILQ